MGVLATFTGLCILGSLLAFGYESTTEREMLKTESLSDESTMGMEEFFIDSNSETREEREVLDDQSSMKSPQSLHSSGADCKYWCKTPKNQFYCCEFEDKLPPILVHPGRCPPVRPECPQSFKILGDPPRSCSQDSICALKDKCCFDVCLQAHVCKPSILN